jgi:hypothetical protein
MSGRRKITILRAGSGVRTLGTHPFTREERLVLHIRVGHPEGGQFERLAPSGWPVSPDDVVSHLFRVHPLRFLGGGALHMDDFVATLDECSRLVF